MHANTPVTGARSVTGTRFQTFALGRRRDGRGPAASRHDPQMRRVVILKRTQGRRGGSGDAATDLLHSTLTAGRRLGQKHLVCRLIEAGGSSRSELRGPLRFSQAAHHRHHLCAAVDVLLVDSRRRELSPGLAPYAHLRDSLQAVPRISGPVHMHARVPDACECTEGGGRD